MLRYWANEIRMKLFLRACLNLNYKIVYGLFFVRNKANFAGIAIAITKNLTLLQPENSINKLLFEF